MGSESKCLESKDSIIDWNHPARQRLDIIDAELGLVMAEQPRKKVALVGYVNTTGPAGRDEAPYDSPEWEIWGENQLYRFIPRADRWFEIHREWHKAVVPGTNYTSWLAESPIPIYMWEPVPTIPSSVRFPVERYMAKFSDYRTSTIAYMMGLAILEGFTTIGLWGVELAVGTEYFYQRSCLEYLIGVARGAGIEVILPEGCTLCKQAFPYGAASDPEAFPFTAEEFRERLKHHTEMRDKAVNEVRVWESALAELTHWSRLFDMRTRLHSVHSNILGG